MAHDFLIDAADGFLREMQAALRAPASDAAAGEAGDVARRLIGQLRAFERNALRLCGSPEAVTGASYLLCTLADELLTRRMGLNWTLESLLVYHHADAHGGQRCWALLDELLAPDAARRQPHRKPLLALYDLAIALGMRGVHALAPGGEQALHQLRTRLQAELGDAAAQAPGPAEMMALATRHARPSRRWLGLGLAAAVLLAVAGLHAATQRQLEAQWLAAARDAAQAAAPALDPVTATRSRP